MVRALTMSLVAAVAAFVVSVGGVAHAQDVCPGYYVTMFKSNLFGTHSGEGIANYNPGAMSITTREPAWSFVAFGGVTRPRRNATFRFTDESGNYVWFNRGGVSMMNFVTTDSGDNGVIRQESNVLPWTGDLAKAGQKLNVYGDFSHRCGGDDIRVNNVFLGTIMTYPSVPIEINPKYVVLSVAYSPPGRQSSVDYGQSTTVGSRQSSSATFQAGVTVTNTRQQEERTSISTSGGFTQRATIGGADSIEKAESTNFIIPGPATPIETIPHDFDIYEVWLNPRFTVTSTSKTAVETSGFSVDPRDPVPGMDIVRLSTQELRTQAFPAGTASRLERTWSPTGALTTEDFNTILSHNPFANGGTAIDPARYTLLDTNFDFRPAEPGGQPLTQRLGVRATASSTQSQSFTTTVKVSKSIENTTFEAPNPKIVELDEKIQVKNKVEKSFEQSFTLNLDQFNTATQSTTVSITGPSTGYQGPTALQLYQDNRFGTFMFAFAPVATFTVGTPPDRTVTQGGTASFPITTQAQNGFSNNITFDPNVMGLPPGAQASFSPSTVGPNGSSTLNVTTAVGTTPGTYPLTFTSVSNLIRRHQTVNLTVQPLPFSVGATPASQTVVRGQTATYTVNITSAPGLNEQVQLSGPGGLPPGTTATFSPSTITGSGTSTLTVTTSPSTPGGARNLVIAASNGSTTRTATVGLVVDAAQDFSLGVTPQATGIFAGDTATYNVTTTAINGFGGNVDLVVSGHPAGSTPSFNPNPITGAGTSTLSLATSTSTPEGDYQVTVTGTSGGIVRSQTVNLSVSPPQQDFTLSASPGARSVQAGGNTTYAVSTGSVGGFSGNIGLAITGLPSGATATFNPSAVGAGSSSTLTVNAGSTTQAGTYQLFINGVGGTLSHGQTVSLTVTAAPPAAPDFTLAVGPTGSSAPPGESAIYTVSTSGVNGFTGNIGLAVNGLPTGATASFQNSPVTPGGGATLTVDVPSAAPAGEYELTVTGTSGSLSHNRTVMLTVESQSPGFVVTLDQEEIFMPPLGFGMLQVAAMPTGFFYEPIELSLSGAPVGVSYYFETSPIYPYDVTMLYLGVDSSTQPGTYQLTVTGTALTATNTRTLVLHVI